jgi:hypothetical protein
LYREREREREGRGEERRGEAKNVLLFVPIPRLY